MNTKVKLMYVGIIALLVINTVVSAFGGYRLIRLEDNITQKIEWMNSANRQLVEEAYYQKGDGELVEEYYVSFNEGKVDNQNIKINIVPKSYIAGTKAYVRIMGDIYDLGYENGVFSGDIIIPDVEGVKVSINFVNGDETKTEMLSADYLNSFYKCNVKTEPKLIVLESDDNIRFKGELCVEQERVYSKDNEDELINYVTDGRLIFEDENGIVKETPLVLSTKDEIESGNKESHFLTIATYTNVNIMIEGKYKASDIKIKAVMNTKMGQVIEEEIKL